MSVPRQGRPREQRVEQGAMLVMEMGYYEEVGDADDRDPRLLHLQYRLFPNAALVHDEPRRMHRSWREERTYGFPEWWP